MADAVAVKWSTLFPRTGGSGRGGAFTGKVFTPAMSPYLVRSGDRLVVMPTDQKLEIDPSDLGSDDAFQVVDASRTFDKNNVTIKGDKVAIQIVGAGNDLILDMIGAGNLWEFIVTGDKPKAGETDTRQLLVADSPGYTGDLSGGGSAPSQPSASGSVSSDGTVYYYGGGTNPIITNFIPAEGGKQDVIYYLYDEGKDTDGKPYKSSVVYIWKKGVPVTDLANRWKTIDLLNDEDLSRINREHVPLYVGHGKPTETTGLLDDLNLNYASHYLDLDNGEWWIWPANSEVGADTVEKNLWQLVKGSGWGGGSTPVTTLDTDAVIYYREQNPFNGGFFPPEGGGSRDVIVFCPNDNKGDAWIWPAKRPKEPPQPDSPGFLPDEGSPTWPWDLWNITDDKDFGYDYDTLMAERKQPRVVTGTVDPDVATYKYVGGNRDVFYVNTTTADLFVWPLGTGTPLDTQTQLPRPDAQNLWRKSGFDFNIVEATVPFSNDPNASFYLISGNPDDISDDSHKADQIIKHGDFYIVTFGGSSSRDVYINLPAIVDGVRMKPVRVLRNGAKAPSSDGKSYALLRVFPDKNSIIAGSWDGFDPNVDDHIIIDDPGEFVQFTPVKRANQKPAWIITSASYDSESRTTYSVTQDYPTNPGEVLLVRNKCTITIPPPDLGDPSPITLVAFGGDNDSGPDFRVDIKFPANQVIGSWRGQKFTRKDAPEIFLTRIGEWIRIEPTGVAGEYTWLITDGSDTGPANQLIETSADIKAVQGQTYVVRESVSITLPRPDPTDPGMITVVIYPALEVTTTYQVEIKTDAVDNPDNATYRGITGFIQGDGKKDNKQAMNISGYCAWVRLEPCGTIDDPFWLITDGWTEATG